MNQTIEERMQSVEDQLKEIRKELEESLARHKQSQHPFTNGDVSKFRSGAVGNIPETHKENMRYHNTPCSAHDLHLRLSALQGVEYVYIEDHMNLSVTITVVGGKDHEVARVLANSLASCVKTIGDYQVCTETVIPWKFHIYRSLQR